MSVYFPVYNILDDIYKILDVSKLFPDRAPQLNSSEQSEEQKAADKLSNKHDELQDETNKLNAGIQKASEFMLDIKENTFANLKKNRQAVWADIEEAFEQVKEIRGPDADAPWYIIFARPRFYWIAIKLLFSVLFKIALAIFFLPFIVLPKPLIYGDTPLSKILYIMIYFAVISLWYLLLTLLLCLVLIITWSEESAIWVAETFRFLYLQIADKLLQYIINPIIGIISGIIGSVYTNFLGFFIAFIYDTLNFMLAGVTQKMCTPTTHGVVCEPTFDMRADLSYYEKQTEENCPAPGIFSSWNPWNVPKNAAKGVTCKYYQTMKNSYVDGIQYLNHQYGNKELEPSEYYVTYPETMQSLPPEEIWKHRIEAEQSTEAANTTREAPRVKKPEPQGLLARWWPLGGGAQDSDNKIDDDYLTILENLFKLCEKGIEVLKKYNEDVDDNLSIYELNNNVKKSMNLDLDIIKLWNKGGLLNQNENILDSINMLNNYFASKTCDITSTFSDMINYAICSKDKLMQSFFRVGGMLNIMDFLTTDLSVREQNELMYGDAMADMIEESEGSAMALGLAGLLGGSKPKRKSRKSKAKRKSSRKAKRKSRISRKSARKSKAKRKSRKSARKSKAKRKSKKSARKSKAKRKSRKSARKSNAKKKSRKSARKSKAKRKSRR